MIIVSQTRGLRAKVINSSNDVPCQLVKIKKEQHVFTHLSCTLSSGITVDAGASEVLSVHGTGSTV